MAASGRSGCAFERAGIFVWGANNTDFRKRFYPREGKEHLPSGIQVEDLLFVMQSSLHGVTSDEEFEPRWP